MKKLISIEHLQVGMFLDADVRREEQDGEESKFLEPRNAIKLGTSNKRARLTGRMDQKVETNGGVLISSESLLETLRSMDLAVVTIDTDKGQDLSTQVKPLTDPSRKPPPEGRLVHFDEEIERAKEIREEASETLRETLDDVSSGKGIDMEKIEGASSVISQSIMRNMDALVSLTRIKQHDPYTAMHSMNVCTLVVAMAQADGVDAATLTNITTAALLHDIGKTKVPLEILNKPGRFEPDELAQMRKHAEYSGEILRSAGGFSDEAIAIATQHHEMVDGSGYPLKLLGDQIHPFARMTAVADVYDALTAKRVYKPAMPMNQALNIILKDRGTAFDDRAVELFVNTLGLYPVGSLVELSTSEHAMVFEPNPKDSRKPTVGILTTPKNKLRPAPFICNLGRRSESDGREIVRSLDPDELEVDVEQVMQDINERGERSDRTMR